jgi:hypothetical protein
MAAKGSITWPSAENPIWQLNYALANAPDEEGIVIRDVYYRGKKVLFKASLPCLRVQYDYGAGPYKDPLNDNVAQFTARSPNDKVALYTYISGGVWALCVEAYYIIGKYRLTQRWVFWENGIISPRLYSAGLQYPANHRHHAYWRFDFDIEDFPNDLALEYNNYTPDQGWGRGWHPKTVEWKRLKNPSSNRWWAILDKSSFKGYHIVPGPNDGQADGFSNGDFWVMQYHSEEDKNGRQGSPYSDELQPYINGENADGKDLVVWYCGHLSHEVHAGGDEWHSTGPDLYPFPNW